MNYSELFYYSDIAERSLTFGFFTSNFMSQIKRKARDKNFSIIPNDAINEYRVSFRAKGLLVYLLSKPDNWQVYVSQLSNVGTDGKHSVGKALEELMTFGYIHRVALRDDKGRFKKGNYNTIGFLISKSIFEKGLKPSLFFTKPFERAIKRLPEDLQDAFGEDIKNML